MGQLTAYLRAVAARPFGWGEAGDGGGPDCLMFAADWVRLVDGRDPAAPWRGTYDDEAGAMALVRAHGGVAGLMAAGLAPLGWLAAAAPRAGDVGVVATPQLGGRVEAAAAIRTAGAWAVRHAGGVALIRRAALACWTPEATAEAAGGG